MTSLVFVSAFSGAAIGAWASLWGRDPWVWGVAGAAAPLAASLAVGVRGRAEGGRP